MTRITAIQAREILDSRGNPTVEVDVYLHQVQWVEPLFHLEPLPVRMKPLSCVMVIRNGIWGKA